MVFNYAQLNYSDVNTYFFDENYPTKQGILQPMKNDYFEKEEYQGRAIKAL